MAKILAVGTATIDMIFYLDGYPKENQELRAGHFCRRRGGNATNTLIVLSQFNHRCSWAGTWIKQSDSRVILDELDRFNIDLSFSKQYENGVTPVSTILVNRDNGSRTITHFRDMPEYLLEDFEKIDLTYFDWIHFEGRNVEETEKMLKHIRTSSITCPISIEIEKYRDKIDRLYPFANVLLFSETFAKAANLIPEQLLTHIHKQAPAADVICSLGSKGAIGLTKNGQAVSASAYSPDKVIDTLAAGDTFNAGIIDACLRQATLGEALESACQLAGRKCGQMGLYQLQQSD